MSESSFSGLLKQGAFLRFWMTRLAGTAAVQMLMVTVGWQMYELTGNAWDLGLVGSYQFAPLFAVHLRGGLCGGSLQPCNDSGGGDGLPMGGGGRADTR